MTKIKLKVLFVVGFVIFGVCCFLNTQGTCVENANSPGCTNTNTNTSETPPPPPGACNASSIWVSSPSLPPEIPNNGPTLCEFHQFSWMTFLALMNPPSAGADREFQNEKNYPLLQAKGTDSCAKNTNQSRLFIRNTKDDDGPGDDFVLPEDIKQAGGGAILYDQNGNVVFYEVRFSISECTQDPAKTQFTDPNTTEIKVSYRVITEADKPNYVWINADINGDGTTGANELLGMVGFHLVKSTPLHPEFIWATFEHKSNVPECQANPDPNAKWSFTSAQCAGQLPNSVNAQECNFNIPPVPPNPVIAGGPPTPVCRVYHDGSMKGDNQFDANVADIDMLNTQLVGPSGFITALNASNPLAVLKNYMLVGALWESDITQPSSNLANQRGSIQIANTTMETTFQMAPNFTPVAYTGTSNLQPATNCFACHGYVPNNNVAQSHIFTSIK
jgi:hypothetical protein